MRGNARGASTPPSSIHAKLHVYGEVEAGRVLPIVHIGSAEAVSSDDAHAGCPGTPVQIQQPEAGLAIHSTGATDSQQAGIQLISTALRTTPARTTAGCVYMNM